MNLWHLEWGLVHSRCSVNLCFMKKGRQGHRGTGCPHCHLCLKKNLFLFSTFHGPWGGFSGPQIIYFQSLHHQLPTGPCGVHLHNLLEQAEVAVYCIPMKMAIIIFFEDSNKCWWRRVEIGSPVDCWWNVECCRMAISQKVKYRVARTPCNPSWGTCYNWK
jgi:hypothetical protein